VLQTTARVFEDGGDGKRTSFTGAPVEPSETPA
jgi:hypothetical protein